MKTSEIWNRLKNVKDFVGVFPANKLPKPRNNMCFVVNTDEAGMPGTHWVAVYIKNGIAEYFDSFGLPPLIKDYIIFLDSYDIWSYNTITIQDINSNKCGDFCIAYIVQKSEGSTFSNFVNLFSRDSQLNDKVVEKLVKR